MTPTIEDLQTAFKHKASPTLGNDAAEIAFNRGHSVGFYSNMIKEEARADR